AGALGEDPRPGDREAVGGGADRLHQRDVLLIPVVVVVRHIAGVAVLDLAWRVGKGVPDRRPLAVLVPRALDLIRGRRHTPVEAVGKAAVGGHLCAPPLSRRLPAAGSISDERTPCGSAFDYSNACLASGADRVIGSRP